MLKVCMIAGLAAAAAGGYMYPSEVSSEHPAYRVEESHGDGGVEGTSGKPDGDDAIGVIMRLLGTDSPGTSFLFSGDTSPDQSRPWEQARIERSADAVPGGIPS